MKGGGGGERHTRVLGAGLGPCVSPVSPCHPAPLLNLSPVPTTHRTLPQCDDFVKYACSVGHTFLGSVAPARVEKCLARIKVVAPAVWQVFAKRKDTRSPTVAQDLVRGLQPLKTSEHAGG